MGWWENMPPLLAGLFFGKSIGYVYSPTEDDCSKKIPEFSLKQKKFDNCPCQGSLFWAIFFIICKETFPLKQKVFYSMFANCVHAPSAVCSHFWTWSLFQQIVAILSQNATETVRFLKTFKTRVFLEKKQMAFSMKNSSFSKTTKGDKFAIECVSNEIMS